MGVVSGVADRVAVMYAGQFVEVAESRRLFASVRHPYTEALLGSIPGIDLPSKTRLVAIDGRPADPTDLPAGCRFEPRCTHRRAECASTVPELVSSGDATRHVRCLHPLPEGSTPSTSSSPSSSTSLGTEVG
jgi:peptide/nickel transport system ATP-binding protein